MLILFVWLKLIACLITLPWVKGFYKFLWLSCYKLISLWGWSHAPHCHFKMKFPSCYFLDICNFSSPWIWSSSLLGYFLLTLLELRWWGIENVQILMLTANESLSSWVEVEHMNNGFILVLKLSSLSGTFRGYSIFIFELLKYPFQLMKKTTNMIHN